MKKILFFSFVLLFFLSADLPAQIPTVTSVKIVRAEDERRFDQTLENLLKDPDEKIRARAALAAGRIGDEKAIFGLSELFRSSSENVKITAAFALGEIESAKAAPILLSVLENKKFSPEVRARAVEAAGKIAAANPKDANTPALGKAIISALEFESANRSAPNKNLVISGLTAILRARPEGGEKTAAQFLTRSPEYAATALNTLARLRSKNYNAEAEKLLRESTDPIVRANAARVLGVGEDKTAIDLLLNAVGNDADSRVRVSAVRSLGNIGNQEIGHKLIVQMRKLIVDYAQNYRKGFKNPSQKNELLEIITALGKLFSNTDNEAAVKGITTFREIDRYQSPETETAFAKISPSRYTNEIIAPLSESLSGNTNLKEREKIDWRVISNIAQGVGELSGVEKDKENVSEQSLKFLNVFLQNPYYVNSLKKAVSDILRTYAKFKTSDLAATLKKFNSHNDVIVRATAVELLDEIQSQDVKFGDFENFLRPALEDEKSDDALLALIDAVGKQKTERSTDFLQAILEAISISNPKYHYTKYVARRRIISLLKERGIVNFQNKSATFDSIYGQSDYVRAVSRKNGTVKAVLTTEKGAFTINFFPEDAPLTVDNFVKLARAKYFDGLEVHRVVPNFVMQDGDPRGDGNGSPGWSIRCEINMIPFERGAVGMALSGKDTGGSQWFVTHSAQPHLDGGYTVFGRVDEADMKVVDSIVRGDKILSVRIIENNMRKSAPAKTKK